MLQRQVGGITTRCNGRLAARPDAELERAACPGKLFRLCCGSG